MTRLHKLIILNNKILRILQFKFGIIHALDLYKACNTLLINLMCSYKLVLFTHTWFYSKELLLHCFEDLFIYNSTVFNYSNRKVNNLYVVSCGTGLYRNSFKFLCVKLFSNPNLPLRSLSRNLSVDFTPAVHLIIFISFLSNFLSSTKF